MNILIVGGSGPLGGHAATHLQNRGHNVAIGSRSPAREGTPMAGMQLVQGDFLKGEFTADRLRGFDALVFAAGFSVHDLSPDRDMSAFYAAAVSGQTALIQTARHAGISRVVQIGSFYAQAEPSLIDGNRYIQSRQIACKAGRAEGRSGFDVISVNPPFMVGGVRGLSNRIIDPFVRWAKDSINASSFAPSGGTNFMSYQSLSEAIEGALLRGEPGKAYLVGDENLSIATFLDMFLKAVGNPIRLPSRDESHPVFYDKFMLQGRGNYIRYVPNPNDVARLGYARNDVANGVAEAVSKYDASALERKIHIEY